LSILPSAENQLTPRNPYSEVTYYVLEKQVTTVELWRYAQVVYFNIELWYSYFNTTSLVMGVPD